MGRSPCCDKAKVKRGPWSPEEDTILKNYIQNYGTGGNWIALPHKAGLKRCGKSCRLRWLNYLRPDIKLGGFTEEEDTIISSLYVNIGSRWSVIASHLHGRTDNDVKNHWNTKLKKKLSLFHDTNNSTTTSTTPINQIQVSSPAYIPKQEVYHYQTMYKPMFDHSEMVNYQQTPMTPNSKINSVKDNMSSSHEIWGLSANAFLFGNDYASWSGNDGRMMDSSGDVLTGEFDFRQVLGEVASFNYSSHML